MAKPDQEIFRILTSEFRVSFPHLFEPGSIKGSDKKSYSLEMLFDKATTKLSEIQKPVLAAIKAKWGDDKDEWPSPLMLPYRDGDKPHGKKKEVKEEHKGMWVVKASSDAKYSRPHVVGKDPNIMLEDESEMYPGCYARAHLKAHAYEFADKNGCKFILDGVQFIRDGKAIGGKKPANQMFGVVEGDEGEDLSQDNFDDMGEDAEV